jgi:hypothetical protein
MLTIQLNLGYAKMTKFTFYSLKEAQALGSPLKLVFCIIILSNKTPEVLAGINDRTNIDPVLLLMEYNKQSQ